MIKKILVVVFCVALVACLAVPCFATGYGDGDMLTPIYRPTMMTYDPNSTNGSLLYYDLPLTVPSTLTDNGQANAWLTVYDIDANYRFSYVCTNELDSEQGVLTTIIPSPAVDTSISRLFGGNTITFNYNGIAWRGGDDGTPQDSYILLYLDDYSSPFVYTSISYSYKSYDTGEIVDGVFKEVTTSLIPRALGDGYYVEYSLGRLVSALTAGYDQTIYINEAIVTLADEGLARNCSAIELQNGVSSEGNGTAISAWNEYISSEWEVSEQGFTQWLGNAVGGFFDTRLFSLAGVEFTFGGLFAVIIVLGLGIVIIRAFAGG